MTLTYEQKKSQKKTRNKFDLERRRPHSSGNDASAAANIPTNTLTLIFFRAQPEAQPEPAHLLGSQPGSC
ncbi:hypothetical protein [Deinococcus rubellus]|uniref:hypothetical protein n=1 Tax=Deinococcus rubellus TaxID=1889240 RepID=UPI0031F05799